MTPLLLLHLVDIFDEACAVYEEECGRPPSRQIEKVFARRIADLAKAGERNPDRLCNCALEGVLSDDNWPAGAVLH